MLGVAASGMIVEGEEKDGEEGVLHASKLAYAELRQHNITEKVKGWIYNTCRHCNHVLAAPPRSVHPPFQLLGDVVLTQFG
eukprot:416836-Prorocentrum_minimum.AAC.1